MSHDDKPSGPRILVVDDTLANLRVLTMLLEAAGYSVRGLQVPEQALHAALSDPPALFLLDVRMPGMDGFELCRRLKADDRTRAVPVIFVSALSETSDRVRGYEVGAADFISKPFERGEILARVGTHLALRQARDELERRASERKIRLLAENSLEESNAQLRGLAAQMDVVREEERRRLARDMHDELGQYLTALRMGVSVMRMQLSEDDSRTQTQVRNLTGLVDKTIEVVRNLAASLRPAPLEMGAISALEWLADEFFTNTGVHCQLEVTAQNVVLDDTCSTAIFRLAQESLTNVARHAKASQVVIALKREASTVILEIKDNGHGFNAAEPRPKSFGLVGMRERTNILGGQLTVRSEPNGGTTVRASIPISASMLIPEKVQ